MFRPAMLAACLAALTLEMVFEGRLCSQQPPISPAQSAEEKPKGRIGTPSENLVDAKIVNDTDAIVICPQVWQSELKPWLIHRQKQGLSIQVLDTAPTKEKLQAKIRTVAAENPERLKYVLLIGDVANAEILASGDWNTTVPTHYESSTAMVRFGSEPHIATDNPYGDLNGDSLPELAVGRIPCDSGGELRSWIERVIAYELHQDFSEWRRRVHVVAGVGGFGALIDSAVEMTAKQFLSQGIPHGYSISLTQASPSSPYCPTPAEFSQSTIHRFNEGGLFWIYMGHGNIGHLDFIREDDLWHCIMDEKCLPKIQPGPKSPIAVFLACYTGAFDAKDDSIAERLLKQPNGPIAALAGSRMTGPYGMSVLGSEMLEICFDERCETLGEILRQAKCRAMRKVEIESASVAQSENKRQWIDRLATALSPSNHDLDQERLEHLHMMNLLGDPMLRIQHPEPITLQVDEVAESSSRLKVRGYSAVEGKLTLDLIVRRDRVPEPARQAFQRQKNAVADTKVGIQGKVLTKTQIYDLANRPILANRSLRIPAGDFEVEIDIPADAKGACALRAFVESESSWGLGAKEVTIRAPKK